MLVVEINVIDPEPAQASLARLSNVVRLAIHAAKVGIGRVANNPEFCRQHHLFALAFDRASDEFFVLVWAVYIGCVEKIDSEFQSAMNSRDRFVVIASAVELRHSHTAEPDSRNGEASTSEFARFHDCSCKRFRNEVDK